MKRNNHIELIAPAERLSPELGGTGYVGPGTPAEALALYVDAVAAYEQWPDLNQTVWKVLQSSVNWRRYAKMRRLCIGNRYVPCQVIGSVRDWWFVGVEARKAAEILKELTE